MKCVVFLLVCVQLAIAFDQTNFYPNLWKRVCNMIGDSPTSPGPCTSCFGNAIQPSGSDATKKVFSASTLISCISQFVTTNTRAQPCRDIAAVTGIGSSDDTGGYMMTNCLTSAAADMVSRWCWGQNSTWAPYLACCNKDFM